MDNKKVTIALLKSLYNQHLINEKELNNAIKKVS